MVIANDCVFPENWTVDTLMGPHRSHPYNPLIAYALYRAGFIEFWGRGIQKIKESCEGSGNEFPTYTILPDEVSVEFKALKWDAGQDVGQGVGQGVGQEKNEREAKILELIMEDCKITKQEIAQKMKISEKTVERVMKTMPNIKYIGSGYSGHWEIEE